MHPPETNSTPHDPRPLHTPTQLPAPIQSSNLLKSSSKFANSPTHLHEPHHVGNVCRSGFYQIRQLRIIRRNLTFKTAATLVHAFVISRIDYCNAVLSGITKQQLDRVQKLLNTAARLLLRIPKFDHISAAIRDTLHWLPVSHRVLFKICILVWNSITRTGPSYLQELCVLSSVNSVRDLRSSDRLILKVPRCRTATLQKRGFSVVGPVSWNGLRWNFVCCSMTVPQLLSKIN